MALYSSSHDKMADYYLEVSRGNVVGTSSVHIFGLAEDIDPSDGEVDIWDGNATDIGGKIENYNHIDVTTPLALGVSSSSTDTVEITIEGLDANGLSQTITATLTGQTEASIPGLWTAINLTYNSDINPLDGNVFIYDAGSTLALGIPTDPLVVRNIIHSHANNSQQAVYTVALDSSLYIKHAWSHISKAIATEAIVTIYRKEWGSEVFRAIHPLALQTTGSSGDNRPYDVPLRVGPGDTLTYRATAFSNNTAVTSGFHGVLIKE